MNKGGKKGLIAIDTNSSPFGLLWFVWELTGVTEYLELQYFTCADLPYRLGTDVHTTQPNMLQPAVHKWALGHILESHKSLDAWFRFDELLM